MKLVNGVPVLSAQERRVIRMMKTRSEYQHSISGRPRTKPPAPITLRLKDRNIGNS